jgi:hypothetical protein
MNVDRHQSSGRKTAFSLTTATEEWSVHAACCHSIAKSGQVLWDKESFFGRVARGQRRIEATLRPPRPSPATDGERGLLPALATAAFVRAYLSEETSFGQIGISHVPTRQHGLGFVGPSSMGEPSHHGSRWKQATAEDKQHGWQKPWDLNPLRGSALDHERRDKEPLEGQARLVAHLARRAGHWEHVERRKFVSEARATCSQGFDCENRLCERSGSGAAKKS